MKSKADFKSNIDDALKEISFTAFLMLAICIADNNNDNNNDDDDDDNNTIQCV